MKSKRTLVLLLTAWIAACTAPVRDNASPVKLPEPEIHPPSTATTVLPGLSCPIPFGAPPLPTFSSSQDWATNVLTYLNQGGSITAFIEALPSLGQHDPHGQTALTTDLNGDRFEDLVITLIDPDQGPLPVESALLIYLCDRDQYRLAYASSSLPDADRFHLNQVMDLTGDEMPEILILQEICGAHTCFQVWEVLQWQTNRFLNVLDGRSDDLPVPSLEISDPQQDGSRMLSLTGNGIQSAGAGPTRALTRIWHWSTSEARFKVFEERFAAPTFRIHALHDADQAALSGNFDDALRGYNRVIEDPSLDDYPFGEAGHSQLSAYALFRSMLLWIQRGDRAQAEATFTFLKEAFPMDSPGGAYSALASEAWQAFQVQPDLGHVCQIAQAYALGHQEEVLNPLAYGYANKQYLASDICPYTS
jgi:hypothetical protein